MSHSMGGNALFGLFDKNHERFCISPLELAMWEEDIKRVFQEACDVKEQSLGETWSYVKLIDVNGKMQLPLSAEKVERHLLSLEDEEERWSMIVESNNSGDEYCDSRREGLVIWFMDCIVKVVKYPSGTLMRTFHAFSESFTQL